VSTPEDGGRFRHNEDQENKLFRKLDHEVILKARVKPFRRIQGFTTEDREVVEESKDFNITCRARHLRLDDLRGDRWDLGSSLFLLGKWDAGMSTENMRVIVVMAGVVVCLLNRCRFLGEAWCVVWGLKLYSVIRGDGFVESGEQDIAQVIGHARFTGLLYSK
jgi:hypothetical protein